MKIEKSVSVDVDVDVDVCFEDIVAAIWEDPDRQSTALRGINNCHRFLKAIPDEIVSKLNDKQRETIFSALTEQVQRFRPTASVPREPR